MSEGRGRGIVRASEIPKARTVLLILDMLSDFDFPQGDAVLHAAKRIAPRIARLKARAEAARIPAIYVNDNLGRWRSDIEALLARCLSKGARGRAVVSQVVPAAKDFVLLKPRHSGFYATPLAALLEECGAQRLILTGLSSHQCVLFTANDAYLRELELLIPRDCTGAASRQDSALALRYFESVLGADTRASTHMHLKP